MSPTTTASGPTPTGCPDNSFGPWAGPSCRGGFDFTLFFEETILTVPIQCLFLYVLPYRILSLVKEDVQVRSGILRPLKTVAAIVLAALNIAILVLWTKTSDSTIKHTSASIPAQALVVGASVGTILLSWLEHSRSIRPSFVLSIYLLLSIILDLAHTRTIWMLGDYKTIPIVSTISLVVKAILLVLESVEKRRLIISDREYSVEVTSGTLNRAVFWWLLPLFGKGFKRNIYLDDLYPLDDKLSARTLHNSARRTWAKSPNQYVPGAFLKSWGKAFVPSLLAPVFPRLCMIGFTYAQPLLIEQAVAFAATPQEQPYNNMGYGLIGAFTLVYAGQAVAAGQYAWRVRRSGARMRGSLNSMIYEKSLKLDISSPSVSPAGALTLVGNDTETIVQGLNQLHEIWAGMVEMAIAIFLIERQLGSACAMPVALGVAVIVGTIFVSIPTGQAQANWIQASQDRVTATSKTLGAVKWLKISGLSDMAFSLIRRLRTRELAISLRYRLLLGSTMVLLVLVPIWSPILTFSTWAGVAKSKNDTLGMSQVFTSYSLIVLLNGPLSNMIVALPVLAGAITSFQRIQNHLNAKERKDNRVNPANETYVHFIPPLNISQSSLTETVTGSENYELADASFPDPFQKKLSNDVIASVQGSFSWAKDTQPVIDIDNWEIRRESLTFVLGPVGCGKSTLLKSLLGELSTFEGIIRTNYSAVTYCDQSPWVPNQTVRKIITGPAPYEEKWYRQVIRACALEEDLRNWPLGEDTVAGTSGISMSGGQKQRLSLARAVYSRKEFLIMDDVFSGLDAATEHWVFHSLLGRNGLCRNAKMTVVSASSKVSRLRYADHLVYLDEFGEIRDQGTPSELEDRLGIEMAAADWNPDLKTEAPPPSNAPPREAQTLNAAEPEDTTRRLGDNSMYMFYARAAGRTTLVILLVSMGIYAFCGAFPTIWLGNWAGAKDPLGNLGKWLGVYVALGVGAVISVGTGIYQILVRIINRSGLYFHDSMVDTVAGAPMSFYAGTDTGVTVNRFSQDLRLIDMELPSASFGVATALSFSIAQFVMVSISSKYMAACLPVLAIILWVIQFVYLRTSRQLRLLDIENKSPLYTQLIESLNGLTTIRAHQWEDWFEEQNMELVDNAQRPAYLLAVLQCWLNFATDMFIMVIAMIFIVLGTTLREEIGPKYIGVGLSNVLGFGNTMKTLVTFWVMLEIALGAVSRVRTFTQNTEQEGQTGPPVEELPENYDWPSNGSIELRNVVASYETSGPILKDVSFEIMPGEKVAICGRTGSGKSSLTLSLLRLMDLDAGSILIDGIDISRLPHEYVRTKLVALPQEPYVFDGTIRLNMDPSQALEDEDIVEVLDRVHLWQKIDAKGGLDSIIGDDFFSPGERQLLVFARAMLRNSRILILDEFSSSLDEHTSVIVDDVVRTWFQGWTIIEIAHKLDAVIDFDKIAVLDAGKLVEFESPKTLLERDTIFRSLYEASSRK